MWWNELYARYERKADDSRKLIPVKKELDEWVSSRSW